MIVTSLFTQINAAFRGSDDDAPTTGTDFALWLATANRKQAEWAGDTKNNWESLFAVDTVASTVAAGTQVYNLGATFLAPSDRVTVTVGSQLYYYSICKPQERDRWSNSVYISSSNPKKLTFVDTISASSPIVGGTITLGGYHLPSDLADGSSTVLVDDPYWLVYAVAAELAFNDITYSDKAPDLYNKANSLYKQMASNNRRGSSNNPRTARTNVNRILSPSSEAGVGTI